MLMGGALFILPMKTLAPIPQCIDCLMSLAKSAAALAGVNDGELLKKVEAVTREILENAAENSLSSPQLAGKIIREIQCLTGEPDPYRQFKAQEIECAAVRLPPAIQSRSNLSRHGGL